MTRTNDKGVVTLFIYVDDVLIVGDKEAIKSTIEDIETKFEIRKEGQLNDYLGCIVKFGDKETRIHQPHSLKKLENKFSPLTEELCNGKLPCAPGLNLMRPKENEEMIDDKKQHDYRSGVGMLLYLTKHTRLDIANAVREHSRMMDGAAKLDDK